MIFDVNKVAKEIRTHAAVLKIKRQALAAAAEYSKTQAPLPPAAPSIIHIRIMARRRKK
jgi:hypothetical protein